MKKMELQVGDELRGNSSYGSIHLFRNGCNLGCVASGMRLTQNLKGFFAFARTFAGNLGFWSVPQKDPWIMKIKAL